MRFKREEKQRMKKSSKLLFYGSVMVASFVATFVVNHVWNWSLRESFLLTIETRDAETSQLIMGAEFQIRDERNRVTRHLRIGKNGYGSADFRVPARAGVRRYTIKQEQRSIGYTNLVETTLTIHFDEDGEMVSISGAREAVTIGVTYYGITLIFLEERNTEIQVMSNSEKQKLDLPIWEVKFFVKGNL